LLECIVRNEIFCLREETDSKRHISRKKSQDWEWYPDEKGQLPKGKRGESEDIIASLNAVSRTGGSLTEACIEPGWRINDILLAAKVLQNTQPTPIYANEAEMRRVFGLVYDVLRCEILFFNINVNRKILYKNQELIIY